MLKVWEKTSIKPLIKRWNSENVVAASASVHNNYWCFLSLWVTLSYNFEWNYMLYYCTYYTKICTLSYVLHLNPHLLDRNFSTCNKEKKFKSHKWISAYENIEFNTCI